MQTLLTAVPYVFEALLLIDWAFLDAYLASLCLQGGERYVRTAELVVHRGVLFLASPYIVLILETRTIRRGATSYTLHHVIAGIDVELEARVLGVKNEYRSDDLTEEGWVLDDDLLRLDRAALEQELRNRHARQQTAER